MAINLVSGNVIPAVTGGVFDFTLEASSGTALLSSPAFVLASYIIEQVIGSMTNPDDGSDWPIYISKMPDGPQVKTSCGAVYDTSGLKDGRIMDGGVTQHHGVQLKIRSSNHNTGWAKIETIALALDAVLNATITISIVLYKIYNITRTSPIISLGSEPGTQERQLFTINFLLTLERITS